MALIGAEIGLETTVDEFKAAVSVSLNSISRSVAVSVVTISIAEADMILHYSKRIFGSSLELGVGNDF